MEPLYTAKGLSGPRLLSHRDLEAVALRGDLGEEELGGVGGQDTCKNMVLDL